MVLVNFFVWRAHKSLVACHRYAVAETSRSLSHFGAVHGPERAAGVDEMEGDDDSDVALLVPFLCCCVVLSNCLISCLFV